MEEEVNKNFNKTALLLGSNQGDKKKLLFTAITLLEKQVGKVLKISSLYKTAAWGKEDQPDFYNLVIVIETSLQPGPLMKLILLIEQQMGRKRMEKWGARTIDIDILFFDDHIFKSPELTIPHPQLQDRKFALIPLAEIEPEWYHPGLKKNINTLIMECKDQLMVTKVK